MTRAAGLAAAVCVLGCGNPEAYYRDGGVSTLPVTTGAAGTNATGAAGTSATGAAGTASATGAAGTRAAAGTTGAAGASATGAAGTASATGAAGRPLPAPEARLVDDFEDGLSTGWIADTVDGNWGVVADGAGKVYQQQLQDSTLSLAIGGKINWADQVVESKVKFVSFSSTSALIYVAVRYQNEDAYYFVALKADGSLKIRKRVDGSTEDIAAYKSGVPIVEGAWHTLGLAAVGTMLVAKYDGVAVAMGTDTALATGGIALGTQNAIVAFDDVRVTPP